MARIATPKTIVVYAQPGGTEPFTKWLNGLNDARNRRRILTRLRRLEHGNFGDTKPVKAGVYELRLFFGPGFRVYFGEIGENLVVLLCGGDKSTQHRDIDTAVSYWQEYQSRD